MDHKAWLKAIMAWLYGIEYVTLSMHGASLSL